MPEENMSVNTETIGKEYEKDLQKRIGEGIHAPKTNTNLLKGMIIGISTILFGLGGINYAMHSGLQEQKYGGETRNIAKPTGLVSYVEYKELEGVTSAYDGRTYKKIDVIIKGSLLGKETAYLDYNQDKKVDRIMYDVSSSTSRRTLARSIDNDYLERGEFEEADKYFAKHIEKLSKEAGIPK